jgi:proline iminopeptidase
MLKLSRRSVLQGATGVAATLALPAWAASSGKTVVNGGEIAWWTVGLGGGDMDASAPTLVFVHGGLGFDHSYFRPFVDPLSADANLLFFDLPGHGQSARTADFATMTFDSLTADVAGLIAALAVPRPVVVGHSWGGFITLNLALAYPDAAVAHIFCCTAPDLTSGVRDPLGGTEEQSAALFGGLFGGPDQVATDEMFAAHWQTALPLYYNPGSDTTTLRADLAARASYSAAAFRRGLELLSPDAASAQYFNLTPRLAEIAVPVHVQYGAGDIWRFGDNERIAASIPGATLTVFPESGHWPFQEEPDSFIADVRGFLSKLPA